MKINLFIAALFWSALAFGQIRGVVQGADSVQTKPLKNVKITLLRAGTTVYSNEDGTFEILLGKQQPDTLLFVAKGYRSDRLNLKPLDKSKKQTSR